MILIMLTIFHNPLGAAPVQPGHGHVGRHAGRVLGAHGVKPSDIHNIIDLV